MLINMVLPGAVGEEPFAFEYSGNYTDNRDAGGKGTVRLNTSGTLTVTGKAVTVSATIVGAGGGAMVRTVVANTNYVSAGGGSGGSQTVEVTLTEGEYEIIVGTGGSGIVATTVNTSAGTGGSTSAFGYTSTGGSGANSGQASSGTAGSGGSPGGKSGTAYTMQATIGAPGGSPNGGSALSATNAAANNGGDGYVELTFI